MLVKCQACGAAVDPETQDTCPRCGGGLEQFYIAVADSEGELALPIVMGKLRIHCRPSGYAEILLGKPFDMAQVKGPFEGRDVYVAPESASILVKRNANILIYAEPNNSQRIAFGPVMDSELVTLALKYVRTTMTDNA